MGFKALLQLANFTQGPDAKLNGTLVSEESWTFLLPFFQYCLIEKKGKRKVQGVPQSQTAAIPRPQEEEETDKSKQAQIEQTYKKH